MKKYNLEYTMVKLEIFIPVTHLEQMGEALRRAGAGAMGHYDSTLSYSLVRGRWRPLPGANPYDGEAGRLCERDEYKIETICQAEILDDVLREIRAAHPYESPAINAIPLIKTGLDL